jgi:hypothetical protein
VRDAERMVQYGRIHISWAVCAFGIGRLTDQMDHRGIIPLLMRDNIRCVDVRPDVGGGYRSSPAPFLGIRSRLKVDDSAAAHLP